MCVVITAAIITLLRDFGHYRIIFMTFHILDFQSFLMNNFLLIPHSDYYYYYYYVILCSLNDTMQSRSVCPIRTCAKYPCWLELPE
jgi:hypothetical protein